jgi:hypothetical protein
MHLNPKNENVWTLLDKFREPKYLQDVVQQNFSLRICQVLIRNLLMSAEIDFEDELSHILSENTMLEPRTVGSILNNNSVKGLF